MTTGRCGCCSCRRSGRVGQRLSHFAFFHLAVFEMQAFVEVAQIGERTRAVHALRAEIDRVEVRVGRVVFRRRR